MFALREAPETLDVSGAYWVQKAVNPKKKCTLHRQLGYSCDEKLPVGKMAEIEKTPIGNKIRGKGGRSVTNTALLKHRALFANRARKFKHAKVSNHNHNKSSSSRQVKRHVR